MTPDTATAPSLAPQTTKIIPCMFRIIAVRGRPARIDIRPRSGPGDLPGPWPVYRQELVIDPVHLKGAGTYEWIATRTFWLPASQRAGGQASTTR